MPDELVDEVALVGGRARIADRLAAWRESGVDDAHPPGAPARGAAGCSPSSSPSVDGARRIYLMRHGAVAYFDDDGRPVAPDDVPLTAEGRRQAQAAGELLEERRSTA